MAGWILKTEPSTYSFAQLQADGRTAWTGIRNYAARNHLRAMKVGDLCLIFHTGDEKALVGLAKVVAAASEDPTAAGEDWSKVDLAPVKPLAAPVTLATIKATRALAALPLVKQGRLSVSPVGDAEWKVLLGLAKTKG